MACTVAVETVIGQHYNDQIRTLLAEDKNEAELLAVGSAAVRPLMSIVDPASGSEEES